MLEPWTWSSPNPIIISPKGPEIILSWPLIHMARTYFLHTQASTTARLPCQFWDVPVGRCYTRQNSVPKNLYFWRPAGSLVAPGSSTAQMWSHNTLTLWEVPPHSAQRRVPQPASFPDCTSKISSLDTSMRQWPAWGC